MQATEIPPPPKTVHKTGKQDAKHKHHGEDGKPLARESYFAGHIPSLSDATRLFEPQSDKEKVP